MKKAFTLMILLFILFPLAAMVDAKDKPFTVKVEVDSAFTRAEPFLGAPPLASVFEGNKLEAIGRNIDGTWFELQRVGRGTRIGWISKTMISYTFEVALLPITNTTTGLVGTIPVVDTGTSVFILQDAIMRDGPLATSRRILSIPAGVTIPVIERNQDGSRLRVNYLGNVGWISGFIAGTSQNLQAVPPAANLPPLPTLEVVIIPKDIQLAQLQRLRNYIVVQRDMAVSLESFWWSVFQGKVMPCEPPGFITEYKYNKQDVKELPELNRLVPRLSEGIDSLNVSINTMQPCGVFDENIVLKARNAAINAKIIFNAALDSLKDLEKNIIR